MKYVVNIRRVDFGSVEVEADSWEAAAQRGLQSCDAGDANWNTSFDEVTGIEREDV